MKGTVFYKMTGSGNDFVVLDGRGNDPADWSTARITALCDRRDGVGADGLVILTPEGSGPLPGRVRMTFFNCDGSPAAMCGNAALCSTTLSRHLGLAPGGELELVTPAGTFRTRCVGDGTGQAELNLPGFDRPREVPSINRRPGEEAIYFSTVGVPHLVVLVRDLETLDLEGRGRELRRHPALAPAGANVNFIAPSARPPAGSWVIRTYERGVEGETLACGTGAAAAGATLQLLGRAESPVVFSTRSGRFLEVRTVWSRERVNDVWLKGEGRLVFEGQLPGE
ncbi:MAG: diaminopimelate epimerase [Gemmatimonadales bacterium]